MVTDEMIDMVTDKMIDMVTDEMIDMVTDDDAHLDSKDDHIGRGGDDQEEVGHVHQPGEGQGAGDVI